MYEIGNITWFNIQRLQVGPIDFTSPRTHIQVIQERCADVEDGGPALEEHWVKASCLLGCGHSWSANSSHWHNVSLIVAHRLQHWADISPALAYQYIGLNKINVHPMLAYCWPIVYDHGSAVKQHWLKVSFLAGNTGNSIPWHNVGSMLEECHRWWHNI